MSTALDMDRIAQGLGAERRGKITARGGYFGALQLAAEVAARLRVPPNDESIAPTQSEERIVQISTTTLEQLDQLAERFHTNPMQVAALLLEQAVQTAVNLE
jgi:hypothetical protein